MAPTKETTQHSATLARRKSLRLPRKSTSTLEEDDEEEEQQEKKKRSQKRIHNNSSSQALNKSSTCTTTATKRTRKVTDNNNDDNENENENENDNMGQEFCSLPRTRERAILQHSNVCHVMGIDEAGRGPLAGPVVTAAVFIAPTAMTVAGICDSKKINKEQDRQQVLDRFMTTLTKGNDMLWAAAIMDASYIDQVNILQATLHGMTLAAQAVMHMHQHRYNNNNHKDTKLSPPPPPLNHIQTTVAYHDKACCSIQGCYVVTNSIIGNSTTSSSMDHMEAATHAVSSFYALIDGNRLPPGMPCAAETMTKGDGKEYCIAAASIVAKVIRDNLMRQYHNLYPHYNLEQHKGYPTAAHLALIREIGSVPPIYRRSFAPLKHLEFDDHGTILGEKQQQQAKKKPPKKANSQRKKVFK